MTVEVALALAGVAFASNDVGQALGYLVGFQGVLRSGEIFAIQWKKIECGRRSAFISLGLTKSGQRRGHEESVMIDDVGIVTLLAAHSGACRPGDYMVGKTPSQFRAVFAQHLSKLGLSGMGYKCYSLRRGGATHLFRVSGSFDTVANRGRWGNVPTARIYVNEAVSELPNIRFTAHQMKTIRKYVAITKGLLE